MKFLSPFIFSLFLSFPLVAMVDSLPPISAQEVSLTLHRHAQDNNFRGVLLVAEQGQVITQQSTGSPSEDHEFPYNVFPIASITKLFTSIVILQLNEEGKIQLNDPIQKWLPELDIPAADQITLHHLLLHISGLPNEKDRTYLRPMTPLEMVEASLNNRENTFESFNYNNLDYFLLGLIIEKATGNSWQYEVRNRILDPHNMNWTGFLKKDNLPPGIAKGYKQGKKGNLVPDRPIYWENFFAAGCMYSNAGDLLKLDQALYGEELLSSDSKTLLSVSYPEYNYVGYGVWNYQYPFVETTPTIMERRGGVQGINVVLVRLTDHNRTIIILSNTDQFNPDSFGDPSNLREELIKLCTEPEID